MNILLTGASGFLGRRIYHELAQNHTVTTLGRTPVGNRHIPCDLATHVPMLPNQPFDMVVHAAGKAHSLPRATVERFANQRVNIDGTIHLLTALEQQVSLPTSIVHISTVLVYGRLSGEFLPETTPLLARDAYGLSKVRAEILMNEWAERTGARLAVLRLPLVVAEQPKGNLAAMLTAIRRGYYIRIGDGLARRSMVRADDVAAIITRAANAGGTFNLTDGYHPPVRELEKAMAHQLGRRTPIPAIPMSFAKAIAKIGNGINRVVGRRFPFDSIVLQKLTQTLTFSDDLARHQLNWKPRPVLDVFR